MSLPDSFDAARARGARALAELAAATDDEREALIHQMAADDLVRKLSPEEEAMLRGMDAL